MKLPRAYRLLLYIILLISNQLYASRCNIYLHCKPHRQLWVKIFAGRPKTSVSLTTEKLTFALIKPSHKALGETTMLQQEYSVDDQLPFTVAVEARCMQSHITSDMFPAQNYPGITVSPTLSCHLGEGIELKFICPVVFRGKNILSDTPLNNEIMMPVGTLQLDSGTYHGYLETSKGECPKELQQMRPYIEEELGTELNDPQQPLLLPSNVAEPVVTMLNRYPQPAPVMQSSVASIRQTRLPQLITNNPEAHLLPGNTYSIRDQQVLSRSSGELFGMLRNPVLPNNSEPPLFSNPPGTESSENATATGIASNFRIVTVHNIRPAAAAAESIALDRRRSLPSSIGESAAVNRRTSLSAVTIETDTVSAEHSVIAEEQALLNNQTQSRQHQWSPMSICCQIS